MQSSVLPRLAASRLMSVPATRVVSLPRPCVFSCAARALRTDSTRRGSVHLPSFPMRLPSPFHTPGKSILLAPH
eukprot:2753242-Rhodomonas_salina.1